MSSTRGIIFFDADACNMQRGHGQRQMINISFVSAHQERVPVSAIAKLAPVYLSLQRETEAGRLLRNFDPGKCGSKSLVGSVPMVRAKSRATS